MPADLTLPSAALVSLIPRYVSDGNVDMGITGLDIIAESASDVDVLMKLGMGRCKLCFQVCEVPT